MSTLDNLLTLYASTDKNVMQIGWTANALLNELIEEEKQAGDKHPVIRPILTNLLDELCGIDGQPGMLVKYYPNAAAARSSVSDRLRVMRYFTEKYVSGLAGRFGFNHLRACYVGDEQNWPEADVRETSLRVTWAQENGWPSPDEIRQHFGSGSKLQNEKEIKNLERAAMCVRDNPAHPIMVRDSAANCIMAIQGSVKLSEPDEFIKLSIEQALKLLAGNADDVLDYISGTLSEVEQPELLEAE